MRPVRAAATAIGLGLLLTVLSSWAIDLAAQRGAWDRSKLTEQARWFWGGDWSTMYAAKGNPFTYIIKSGLFLKSVILEEYIASGWPMLAMERGVDYTEAQGGERQRVNQPAWVRKTPSQFALPNLGLGPFKGWTLGSVQVGGGEITDFRRPANALVLPLQPIWTGFVVNTFTFAGALSTCRHRGKLLTLMRESSLRYAAYRRAHAMGRAT